MRAASMNPHGRGGNHLTIFKSCHYNKVISSVLFSVKRIERASIEAVLLSE